MTRKWVKRGKTFDVKSTKGRRKQSEERQESLNYGRCGRWKKDRVKRSRKSPNFGLAMMGLHK